MLSCPRPSLPHVARTRSRSPYDGARPPSDCLVALSFTTAPPRLRSYFRPPTPLSLPRTPPGTPHPLFNTSALFLQPAVACFSCALLLLDCFAALELDVETLRRCCCCCCCCCCCRRRRRRRRRHPPSPTAVPCITHHCITATPHHTTNPTQHNTRCRRTASLFFLYFPRTPLSSPPHPPALPPLQAPASHATDLAYPVASLRASLCIPRPIATPDILTASHLRYNNISCPSTYLVAHRPSPASHTTRVASTCHTTRAGSRSRYPRSASPFPEPLALRAPRLRSLTVSMSQRSSNAPTRAPTPCPSHRRPALLPCASTSSAPRVPAAQ
jgi:hypothetical protein